METTYQEKAELKKSLLAALTQKLQKSVAELRESCSDLQVSAASESKSSVGDKYETGRAMIQLELEKIGQQLSEKENALASLRAIRDDVQEGSIQRGAVVKTSEGNYYLMVSAGLISRNDESFNCISPSSPLGQVLLGKTVGEKIILNRREIIIQDFF